MWLGWICGTILILMRYLPIVQRGWQNKNNWCTYCLNLSATVFPRQSLAQNKCFACCWRDKLNCFWNLSHLQILILNTVLSCGHILRHILKIAKSISLTSPKWQWKCQCTLWQGHHYVPLDHGHLDQSSLLTTEFGCIWVSMILGGYIPGSQRGAAMLLPLLKFTYNLMYDSLRNKVYNPKFYLSMERQILT